MLQADDGLLLSLKVFFLFARADIRFLTNLSDPPFADTISFAYFFSCLVQRLSEAQVEV